MTWTTFTLTVVRALESRSVCSIRNYKIIELDPHTIIRGLVFSNIRGFLAITFLFLIFRSWNFAWLDLLGAYFEKWSRFVRTTTLIWVSTTWSPSLRRGWSPSRSNSVSGHHTQKPGFDTKIKPVACPEAELLLHEELHHLLREGDHVVDTHVNVVVRTNRDHFSK